MIPSIEYNCFLWFTKLKNIFPGFFWIEILKIVIFSLFCKFRSRSWIDSWKKNQNDSFMFLCVLLCFVHDMDTIWIDLIKYRSLNSVDLSLPFKVRIPTAAKLHFLMVSLGEFVLIVVFLAADLRFHGGGELVPENVYR